MTTTTSYDPLVADREDLNQVRYAARDFASAFDALVARCRAQFEDAYGDFATTSQGVMLIDLMAWALDQVQWYLDRTASDCYLDTARTAAAVQRLVRQLGYKLAPAAAAQATLTAVVDTATLPAAAVTWAARSRVQGPGGLIWETTAPATWAFGGATTQDVGVRQGETRTLTWTADGSGNQAYALTGVEADRWVAGSSVEVWVDGTPWAEVTLLPFAATAVFEVDYAADPPLLRFGDGVAGAVPPAGAEVKVRFVVIAGAAGNEARASSLGPVLDFPSVVGVTVAVTGTNAAPASGGADPEDADRARAVAPDYFAARGAAVTAPDYAVLAGAFSDPLYGRVARAGAHNPRYTGADITLTAQAAQIRGAIDGATAAMVADEATLAAAAAAAGTYVTAADALMDVDLTNLRGDMDTWVRSAIVQAGTAGADANTATGAATATTAAVNSAIATNVLLRDYANVNLVGGAVKTQILAYIDQVASSLATAGANAARCATLAGGVATVLDAMASGDLNSLKGAIVGAPGLANIPQIAQDTSAACGAALGSLATVTGTATDLVDRYEDDVQTPVDGYLTALERRAGELYASDCRSNRVQVAVLAADALGDYVAPPVGLVNAVQAYLEGVKDVTHQVEVVDGSSVILRLDVHLSIVASPAYAWADVAAAADAAVRTLLRARAFGVAVYNGDVVDAVQAASGGVLAATAVLTCPTRVSAVDSNNNARCAGSEVFAVGTVTVTAATA